MALKYAFYSLIKTTNLQSATCFYGRYSRVLATLIHYDVNDLQFLRIKIAHIVVNYVKQIEAATVYLYIL